MGFIIRGCDAKFSFSQCFLFRGKLVNEKQVLVDIRGMFDGESAKVIYYPKTKIL